MRFDSEYFCPRCGAILNNQSGFDPAMGTWKCTHCGLLLIDDDINDGDNYKGVAWFCDNCGALLNRQEGFTDSNGSWKCTECGHENGTTDENIIDEDNIEHFKCPKCGAILDIQRDFSKYEDDWECRKCGAHLHHAYSDDEYEEVVEPRHKCPNCGADLNEQWSFSEFQDNWKCTECGAHLYHKYSDEDYTVIKHICPNCEAPLDIQWDFDEDEKDWECTECGAHLFHKYSDEDYTVIKHSCPNCKAPLDIQQGFDAYEDNWKCTECGAHLHHEYNDEDYTVIKYICPNCKAPLDIQWGFNEYDDDWECSECGAHLHHGYIAEDDESCYDEDSEVNFEYSDYGYSSDDCSDDEEDSEEDFEYSDHSYSSDDRNESRETNNSHGSYQAPPRPKESTYSTQNKKKRKMGLLGLLILLLLGIGTIGYIGRSFFTNMVEKENHPGEVKLIYSASSFKDANYYDAIIKLEKQGLSDIRLTPLNDLKGGLFSGDGKKEGKISTIEINGTSEFQSGEWVDEMSVVRITYHSFEKTEKNGYDPDKNNHLIINGIDIALPTYLIEDDKDTENAAYHVKGEDNSQFIVLFDSDDEWAELSKYDSYYILKKEDRQFSEMSGEETVALGKMNDKIYLIRLATMATKSEPEYLHIVMVSPDASKSDYGADYEAILSGIYVPKDSEIRIDFTLKDYKGDNYNNVVSELKAKGFQNVSVENLHDVVLGVFEKEGAVDSISIDGKADYKVGDWVSNQSEVVITYHGKK